MPYQPERLSLAEIAERWRKSLSFVEECVRTYQFRVVVFVWTLKPGELSFINLLSDKSVWPQGIWTPHEDLPFTGYFFFDKSVWPHGATTSGRFKLVARMVMHTYCDPSVDGSEEGLQWSETSKVFIPREEVERFECENGLKANQSPVTPGAGAGTSSEPDLTVKEVAAHLRVSEKTIYRRLQAKTLKGYQIPGGQWRIPQSELDRFRKGT
jgi:excisionase family DNA binding protein